MLPTELRSERELDEAVPALTRLSAPTEFGSYADAQWRWILHSGDVTAHVVRSVDEPREIVGCVLRLAYGSDAAAFGMLLVASSARGRGLGRTLLEHAVREIGEGGGLRLLATCSEMGMPIYTKMGFRTVGQVIKVGAECSALDLAALSLEYTGIATTPATGEVLMQMDSVATGLDRSQTLRALLSSSSAVVAATDMATAAVIGVAVARWDGADVVVGPVIGEERSVLPLVVEALQRCSQGAGQPRQVSMIIADHPRVVAALERRGFAKIFENPCMTLRGDELPGQRERYIAYIHPTLG